MIKVNLLKAKMTEYGFTIEALAKELGISYKTLWTRLNRKPEDFTQDEINKLIEILHLENPMEIFFATE